MFADEAFSFLGGVLRSREVMQALATLMTVERPVYLWGSPGVGKSAAVRQAADTLKLKLVHQSQTRIDLLVRPKNRPESRHNT